MGTETEISWTTHTFNPWIGCMAVSQECKHCYAEVDAPARIARSKGLELWGPPATAQRQVTSEANWALPHRWARAAARKGDRVQVFCASQADVFEDFPGLNVQRARLWDVINATRGILDWQLLTKRPENITRMIPKSWLDEPPRGVWYGTTVGTQDSANKRIPALLEVPAQVRFLSCEPLLEPVTLDVSAIRPRFHYCPEDRGSDEDCEGDESACVGCTGNPIDYVNGGDHCGARWSGIHLAIIGGESGPKARPFNLAWARDLVGQFRAAGTAVFVKQLGAEPVNGDAMCKCGHTLTEHWLPFPAPCRRGRRPVPNSPSEAVQQAMTPEPEGACLCPAFSPIDERHRVVLRDRAGRDIAEFPEDLRIREMPCPRR